MNEIDRNAKLIWDYTHMDHEIKTSDTILALGSMDTRTAARAAELWHQGIADTIVVSGGFGRLTGGSQTKSEAHSFREVLLANNIPDEVIVVEDTSTNTGENLILSIKKLEQLGKDIKQVVIVTQPSSEKRTYATVRKLLPGIVSLHTSPQLSYEDYPEGEMTKDLAINIMVGEVQRMKLYPELGYITPIDVPAEIEAATKYLIEAGFDKQLIK